MLAKKPPVVVIVGPTASGKTSLSIAIAQKFSGEVVSADSRQVYRGLDIGSGKVTKEEMGEVPHHLLDIADPMNIYNASDFKRDASLAIKDIFERGHLPIIAGGTFFYVDVLLGEASLPEVPPNDTLRAELENKSVAELYLILEKLDRLRANTIDKDNPRRLVRAIEVATALGQVPPTTHSESPYQALKLGIEIDKEILHQNIHDRLMARLELGMVEEVENLIKEGVTHDRLENFGLEYRYLSRYLRGEIDYGTMVTEIETKSRQFAKRQLTWLKRDNNIMWIDPTKPESIYLTIDNFLQS